MSVARKADRLFRNAGWANRAAAAAPMPIAAPVTTATRPGAMIEAVMVSFMAVAVGSMDIRFAFRPVSAVPLRLTER
ncbi:hypothetical protein GCM10007890_43940 [Methylobacterium tardum]|uniref:Uncharacterized protein n=1 Tax=Methylobacterium tardum TaxID=374432 RepID=A0AA37TJX5_9HYPH|nr:hypothetical protein GCM10007890_43940 [Methylobacterium tardum]